MMGDKKPSADLLGGHKLADNGAIVVGTRGTMSSVEWTGGDWGSCRRIDFAISNHPGRRSRALPGTAITRSGWRLAAAVRLLFAALTVLLPN